MADITKSEVKSISDKQIEVFMSSGKFKSKVEQIIKDRIKHEKELENRVVDITKNVMTQLYKALWLKRNVIISQLKNQKA